MRLTPRGWCTLTVAIGLIALGVAAGYPVLITLGAIAVGAVVAAVGVAGRRPRVEVIRELFPDRVERGGRAGITLRVHNPGTRRQAGFIAVDRVGADRVTVAVRALPPRSEQSYLNELPTGRRGRHEVGPMSLRRADALGLGRSELLLGETATLWVYPKTHPISAVALGLPLHHHDGEATETSPRGSLDVREVRAYVPGDEVRHLHWKATARTGQLMIRDYADPHQPRFTVLLDDRHATTTPEEFEEGVELAASLVVAAAGADHRCQLVTPGGLDLSTDSGADAVQRYLEALCLVTPTRAERGGRGGAGRTNASHTHTGHTDANRAGAGRAGGGLPLVPAALARAGGGTLVVIASAMSADDRLALAGLRPRYSDVVVVSLDGAVRTVPGVRVLGALNAVDAIRQWQTVIA